MAYAELEYFLSIGLLSTAMLGMGATLTTADFRKVAQTPQAMLLMFLVQVVISPLIAIGLSHPTQKMRRLKYVSFAKDKG